MKIILIQTQSFTQNASGVPRITYNLGEYFFKKGLDVAYFSFKEKGHINVNYGRLYHAKEKGGSNNKTNLDFLKEMLRAFNPDIVVNQTPYTNEIRTAIDESKKEVNFKVISCIHNSLFTFKDDIKLKLKLKFKKPLGNFLGSSLFRWIFLLYHKLKHRKDLISILNSNDLTLLYTPPNYEELKYFLKPKDYKDSNIGLMPNPVVGLSNKVPHKENIILHVGSIKIQQKRSDLLLDFWENTYQQLPDWKFQILGTGEYFNTLKEDLEKRKLPRIEILGFQSPDEYYKKAAIFMMPSAYEGLPNTIIEANSYGCPVIAFNSYAALDWIVDHDKNALLVKPYDTKQMANFCAKLANDRNRLEFMQESALANAKRFSIEHIGQQWLNEFEKLKL